MEFGYFINRVWTPLEKIDWTGLKKKGITAVYIRCAEENLEAISTFLPAIKVAGLKPYAWTWQGFTRYQDTVNKGWNICADIERNTNLKDLPEIKNIRAITKASNKTFILCTKAEGTWDGDQAWGAIAPYCDYIMPMLYLGDYNKTVAQLVAYMKEYNIKYPGKVYPALETYISDANPTPKTKAVLDTEITAVKPYCKGIGLFRYGLSNFDNTVVEVVKVVTYTQSQWKTIQSKLKSLGYYKGLIDGVSGSYTVAAVKAFQKAKGLLVDGIVGPVTLSKLGIDFTAKPVVSYPSGYTETNGLSLYRQSTGYTCGPTSLKMALSRYGFYPGEMTLASYAGTSSSSGSTHAGLIKAASKVTSTLKLQDKKFAELGWVGVYNHLKNNVPVLAHIESFINAGVSGHYVVIFGIDMNNKMVKLGDPSYGVRTVSFDTMERKMAWIVSTGRSSTVLMPLVKA